MAVVPQPHGGALTPYKKGQSGNPYGPPKKLTSQVLADLKAAGYERVGPSSVTEASEQLIGVPESVLRSIAKDTEQPVFMRILAETLLKKNPRMNMQLKNLSRKDAGELKTIRRQAGELRHS